MHLVKYEIIIIPPQKSWKIKIFKQFVSQRQQCGLVMESISLVGVHIILKIIHIVLANLQHYSLL